MTLPSPAFSNAAHELEHERVGFLLRLGILDTPPEARIDAITREAAHFFKVPMVLVTLIDSDTQWIKPNTGLVDFLGPRNTAFCHHTIQRLRLLVVENALTDPRFCGNPMVRNPPHIRFYAGAPLMVGARYRLGSLCILDDIPRTLDSEGRSRLWQFSAAASQVIEDLYMSQPAPEHAAALLPSCRYS